MYDIKKYKMVEVSMDKRDYALDTLIEDLPPCLYRFKETENEVCYRGLMRIRDVEWLELIRNMSPYGNGYTILIENRNILDPGDWHKWGL